MPHRLLSLALPLLLVAPTVSTAAEAPDPTRDITYTSHPVEQRWGLGVAYGNQHYGEEGESGTVRALQLTYRAFISTPEEGQWLYELGFERAISDDNPEITDGEYNSINASGLFYRFNRLFGDRYYLGGRVGMSRIRGGDEAETSNLDLVLGLQAGVRITSWLEAGVEVVSASLSLSERAGYPTDIRGVLTLSY